MSAPQQDVAKPPQVERLTATELAIWKEANARAVVLQAELQGISNTLRPLFAAYNLTGQFQIDAVTGEIKRSDQ